MTVHVFKHKITIPLQDIDAAGVVFFAHLFRYAHEAYECLMASERLSLAQILAEEKYLLPLVHAEADYRIPLRYGETITVFVSVVEIGNSSFTLAYAFKDEKGDERTVAKTVHVVLNAIDKKKVEIPAELKRILSRYSV